MAKGDYKALTFIHLPIVDETKAPGATITADELEAAGQTADDIQALMDGGSLSDDMNAELHPDHQSLVAPEGAIVDADQGGGSE